MKTFFEIGITAIVGAFALALYLGRDTPEQRWQRDREREARKWR